MLVVFKIWDLYTVTFCVINTKITKTLQIIYTYTKAIRQHSPFQVVYGIPKKTLFSLLHKKTKNYKKMALDSTHNIKVGDSIFLQFLVEGYGCLSVNIQKDSTAKHTIRLKPSFYVTQLNISLKKLFSIYRYKPILLQTGEQGNRGTGKQGNRGKGGDLYDTVSSMSSLCVNTLKDL